MTDLEDISHYLEMQVDYVIGKKITFCQSTNLRKVLDGLKMSESKLTSISIDSGVANSLFFYNGNANKKIIK